MVVFLFFWRMAMEEVLDFISKLSLPYRSPKSDFYKDGNDACQSLKPFGICDYDNEDFYHKPYTTFSCHIPGCERTFETVIQYEAHYNSCHCFTCKECNKNLPNYHLLDLHVSETHDFFFKELAKKKPMYKCFLEECEESFKNPNERRDHCIKTHSFPSDFRFDATRKKVNKKKSKSKSKSGEKMDIAEQNDETKMDVSGSSSNKAKQENKTKEFKGFVFGRSQGRRKPVFQDFSKDLMNSLPST